MFDKLYGMMNWPLIEGIEYTDIDNPKDLLGQHLVEDGLLIQAFIPDAESVQVKYLGKLYDMYKMDEAGFYVALLDYDKMIKYKLVVKKGEKAEEFYDAYSFYSSMDIKELKKFNAGISYEAYDFMGAHKCKVSGVSGVRFCVWAPEAIRVSVVGEFNNWDGRIHQMSRIEDTGIFEIFVPEISENVMYKYEIKKKGGENILKADPYAFKMEKQPGDASVVADIDSYKWNDKAWVDKRKTFLGQSSPVSIYQLSVSNYFKDENGKSNYKDIAQAVADYVKKMGYTHVELMPLMEYYDEGSLGYITNYLYAPAEKYGDCQDLMYFIDYMHTNEIGVILDWTPTQFATDESGMGYFDGSCLYESVNGKRAVNPRNGAHMYNYARPEVTNYLMANAFMWIDKYHVDGLNIVNTAEMLYHDYNRNPGEWEANIYGGTQNLEAIEFIKHFNSIVHKLRQGIITIADDTSGFPELTGEVSESCLGFDFKWNHEWRKDFMKYMSIPSYMRESHYNDLSLSMIYQYSDSFVVGYPAPEFIGGSSSMISRMAGDTEKRKFDNMKLALSYTYVHPGKKIVFMGQDMAQYSEWKEDEPLDMELLNIDKHKNVNELLKVLNKIYKAEPSLYELDNDTDGFEWINNISARESVLTFVRKGKKEDEVLLVACNFDAVDREDYKIGVPKRGKYKEIFNSDSEEFGGNGFNNPRLKQSKKDECDGREESIRVNLAALSVSIFKYSKIEEKLVDNKTAKANVKKTVKKAESGRKTASAKKQESPKKAESAKKQETVKKAESVKKAEPIKETEPVKETKQVAEPASAKMTKSAKKAETAKEAETVKKAEPAKAEEAVKKVEPAKAAEAVKKAEPIKKSESKKKAEPKEETDSAKSTESAKKA